MGQQIHPISPLTLWSSAVAPSPSWHSCSLGQGLRFPSCRFPTALHPCKKYHTRCGAKDREDFDLDIVLHQRIEHVYPRYETPHRCSRIEGPKGTVQSLLATNNLVLLHFFAVPQKKNTLNLTKPLNSPHLPQRALNLKSLRLSAIWERCVTHYL